MDVGSIVRYKGRFAVVVEMGDQTAKIMEPHVDQRKLQVKLCNITPTGLRMHRMNYLGKGVLVSKKGTIISLQSLRTLRNDTKDGRAILQHAGVAA